MQMDNPFPAYSRRLPGMPRLGGVHHHHVPNRQTDFEVDTDDYEALWDLQERNGDVRKQGLTKHQLNRIPHYKYKTKLNTTQSGKDCCRICLCEYTNGDTVKTLPCFHLFHKKCIDIWLKSQAVCPVCRENIRIH